MLRITVTKSETQAKEYFKNELSRGDYYLGDETIEGRWFGKCAESLGLNGVVTKDVFYRLCENLHPCKEQLLTQKKEPNRRIFYDCSFSVPKSVSILYGLTRSETILSTFHHAVKDTMLEMEESMQVRVRAGRQDRDRTTGNMAYSMFTHHCARPVDGKPDPQLHVHCTVFNVSHDEVEKKYKAAQFGQIKKDAPYYQAAFINRLACGMKELGFGIEATPKGQFEIAGFSKELIEKFSRRTQEIEKKAKELGITSDKTKAELGAKTRKSKLKESSFSILQKEWVSRLSDVDKKALAELDQHKAAHNTNDLQKSYDYALSHCFERKSVLTEKSLWEAVLKQGVGAVKVEDVKAFEHEKVLKGNINDTTFVSTIDVLNEENRMLDLARESKGTCFPLINNDGYFEKLQTSFLNNQQKEAVKYLLTSTCRIDVLSGAAGVGKTTAMIELKKGIEEDGKKVIALAPSSGATDILTREGFEANTLQRFLLDKETQKQARQQVVIVDEAGLVSTKQMKQLFEIAKREDIRVILAGDTGQHNSVERGDALHLLQKTGVVTSYRLDKVVRQKGTYKDAMEAISQGYLSKGYDILDKDLGWVKECKPREIYDQIAAEYIKTAQTGTTLVIAPTHKEADGITDKIRAGLGKEEVLDLNAEKTFATVYALNLTEAEKTDYRNYEPGMTVIFQKRVKGFNKGSKFEIAQSTPEGVKLVADNGKNLRLPTHHASAFTLYEGKKTGLCVNDNIRITANGKSKDEHRLINGANYTITSFTKDGDIVLNNGWLLDKNHGHFAHGYVSTSHSSQGKTVDKALVLYSDDGKKAVSKEGFYVATSRARQQTYIFTTDKYELKEAIRRSSLRLSANEIQQLQVMQKQKVSKQVDLMRFVQRIRKAIAQRSARIQQAVKSGRNNNPELAYLQKNVRAVISKPKQALTGSITRTNHARPSNTLQKTASER